MDFGCQIFHSRKKGLSLSKKMLIFPSSSVISLNFRSMSGIAHLLWCLWVIMNNILLIIGRGIVICFIWFLCKVVGGQYPRLESNQLQSGYKPDASNRLASRVSQVQDLLNALMKLIMHRAVSSPITIAHPGFILSARMNVVTIQTMPPIFPLMYHIFYFLFYTPSL